VGQVEMHYIRVWYCHLGVVADHTETETWSRLDIAKNC